MWNTYGFFINYARLAGWTPPEVPTPAESRSDFDQWILSELHQAISRCRLAYEGYDLKHVIITAEHYMETLSNGYVRYNRHRFWKVGNENNSSIAFETLYECLLTFILLLAPVIPFTTEEVYQNLVRSHDKNAPESVHHKAFPETNTALINKELSNEIDIIMHIIALGLSARERAGIKVRQPLPLLKVSPGNRLQKDALEKFIEILKEFLNVKDVEILEPGAPTPRIPVTYRAKPMLKVIGKKIGKKTQALKSFASKCQDELTQLVLEGDSFQINLEDDSVTLDPEDFVMEEIPEKHLALAEEKGSWVLFDTKIDNDLKQEGLMRDLLRKLQVLRKEIGLEIEDHIRLYWQSEAPMVRDIINRWEDFLKSELLCLEIEKREIGNTGHNIALANGMINVDIVKV